VEPERFALLLALAIAIGAYGTLIGTGGGFLLVPVLLFLYPDESTGIITSISLAVVCVNALSGSLAYPRMHRINYGLATVYGAAAIPGSIVGALAARGIQRALFDPLFGVVLIGLAVYLLRRPHSTAVGATDAADIPRNTFALGAVVSVAIGFLSSLFGIGGGVMHVPLLTGLLSLPLAMATATSQLILAIISFSGTIVLLISGEFQTGWRRTGALSLGVIVGAQIGARLSSRVGGPHIIRLLAAALLLVGARLVLRMFG
jgi:uncharacterized membrane protein YfcA